MAGYKYLSHLTAAVSRLVRRWSVWPVFSKVCDRCVFVVDASLAYEGARVVRDVLTVVFAITVAVNVGRWAQRGGLDADLSSEGLSSLGESSIAILENLERPVEVAIFPSKNTPKYGAEKARNIR